VRGKLKDGPSARHFDEKATVPREGCTMPSLSDRLSPTVGMEEDCESHANEHKWQPRSAESEKPHDQSSCAMMEGTARSVKCSKFVYNDGKGSLEVQSFLTTVDARREWVSESP